MSLIFRRGIASMASNKKASKVCVHWQKLCVSLLLRNSDTGFRFGFLFGNSYRKTADRTHCRDHVKELNNQRPKQPIFFLKPSSSILPPGSGPVIRPKGVDLHYEIELALIMGKQVTDLEASEETRS